MITQIFLSFEDVSVAAVEHFLAIGWHPEAFSLKECHLAEGALAAWLSQAKELRSLFISAVTRGTKLTDGDLRGLAAAPCPLSALTLQGMALSPTGLAALLGAFPSLTALDLGHGELGDGGPGVLFAAELPYLREAGLRDLGLTDGDTASLSNAPWGASFFEGERDAFAPFRATPAGTLALDLTGNDIGPSGARALANGTLLRRVCELDLTDNPLGPEGVAALVGEESSEGLVALRLAGTEPGAEGISALCQSPHLENLVELDIALEELTESDMEALLGAARRTATYRRYLEALMDDR